MITELTHIHYPDALAACGAHVPDDGSCGRWARPGETATCYPCLRVSARQGNPEAADALAAGRFATCAWCHAAMAAGEALEAAQLRTATHGKYFCGASPDSLHHLTKIATPGAQEQWRGIAGMLAAGLADSLAEPCDEHPSGDGPGCPLCGAHAALRAYRAAAGLTRPADQVVGGLSEQACLVVDESGAAALITPERRIPVGGADGIRQWRTGLLAAARLIEQRTTDALAR